MEKKEEVAKSVTLHGLHISRMHFAAVMWRWLAVGGHMGAGRGREPSGDGQNLHRAGMSPDRSTT